MKPTAFFADAKERLAGGFTVFGLVIGFVFLLAAAIFNGWLATKKYELVEFWYEYKDVLPAVAQTGDGRVLWFWVIVPAIISLMFVFLAFRVAKTLKSGTFPKMMKPLSTGRLVLTTLGGTLGLFLYLKLENGAEYNIDYSRWMEIETAEQGDIVDLVSVSDYVEWLGSAVTYIFFMFVTIRAVAQLIERRHLAH